MPFRFVHTADIHLDSPLRTLSLRDPGLSLLIGDATRRAFSAIIDLCLEEAVDALVIAGDLYDGDQTSMKTARFLASELGRLNAAGIAAYVIRGNHDAMSRITAELALPPLVKIFGARPEPVEQRKGALTVTFQGLSFAKPQAPDNLLPKYRPPAADSINIGIMHTSLGGAPGHDVYAPCSLAELDASGFDYWALGHIHQRSSHEGRARVVMPGIPQGRDINESGRKTATLVTVADDRTITIEERATGIAEFQRIGVSLDGVVTWHDLADTLESALGARRTETGSEHLVARLMLSGATPLAFRLRRDRDLLLAEAQTRAAGIGRTFIDKVEIAVTDPAQPGQRTAGDPIAELGVLMTEASDGRHGLREEITRLVKELRDDLPPEIRGFAGEDEAGLDTFVDRLIDEGGADVIARLKADGAGKDS